MTPLEQAGEAFGKLIALAIQQAVQAAIEPLKREVVYLRAQTNEWVDTPTALKLTGIKSNTTLRAERDRPNTVLKFSGIGRAIRYSRDSCVQYAESKRLGRR
ncbi:hypothetical protein [Hymenobacter sp. AT01-02]|uniref:hypothetical protein n=1 Tax=Hymenobacter sp. AT01-02 TaxID=1571877 RepID=UPI0005F0D493|nr:hypothetical protein [Hymenobacter sp. AT01-02]